MLDILDGKDYKILPDFLDKEQYEELLLFVERCSWRHKGYAAASDVRTDAKRFHPIFMDEDNEKNSSNLEINYNKLPEGIRDILIKLNETFNKTFYPMQIYFNCFTHGDEMSFHRDTLSTSGTTEDIQSDKHNVTFILYITKFWEPVWQGATLFKSDKGAEILGGSLPYPNHLVAFDARLLHAGAPISRFCPYKRHILVFQTEYTDN